MHITNLHCNACETLSSSRLLIASKVVTFIVDVFEHRSAHCPKYGVCLFHLQLFPQNIISILLIMVAAINSIRGIVTRLMEPFLIFPWGIHNVPGRDCYYNNRLLTVYKSLYMHKRKMLQLNECHCPKFGGFEASTDLEVFQLTKTLNPTHPPLHKSDIVSSPTNIFPSQIL